MFIFSSYFWCIDLFDFGTFSPPYMWCSELTLKISHAHCSVSDDLISFLQVVLRFDQQQKHRLCLHLSGVCFLLRLTSFRVVWKARPALKASDLKKLHCLLSGDAHILLKRQMRIHSSRLHRVLLTAGLFISYKNPWGEREFEGTAVCWCLCESISSPLTLMSQPIKTSERQIGLGEGLITEGH